MLCAVSENTEEVVIHFAQGAITQGFIKTSELGMEEWSGSLPSRQEGNPKQKSSVNQACKHHERVYKPGSGNSKYLGVWLQHNA